MKMIQKQINIGTVGLFGVELPYLILGQGQPKGLIIALQHGGESASLLVMKQLVAQADRIQGTAVIIPIANPFGQIFEQRNEMIENKDLNRAFPGKKDGDFTGRLANAIFELGREADFVIDLHNFSRLSPVLAGFTSVPQKNQEGTLKLLAAFNPEAVWVTQPQRGEDMRFQGALDQVLADSDIPSIFVETPGIHLVNEAQTKRVVEGLINIFSRFNQPFDSEKFAAVPKYEAQYVYADQAGLFEPLVEPLDQIAINQPIGKLTLLPTFQEVSITSPKSGVLLTIRPKVVIRTGTKLFSLGKKVVVP